MVIFHMFSVNKYFIEYFNNRIYWVVCFYSLRLMRDRSGSFRQFTSYTGHDLKTDHDIKCQPFIGMW